MVLLLSVSVCLAQTSVDPATLARMAIVASRPVASAAASSYWTDPNTQTMWLAFETTNTTQTLDLGDDSPVNNGSNYPNVATGPTWIETGTNTLGRVSKGYDFDGSADYFLVNTNTDLDQRPITIAFWAKLNSASVGGAYNQDIVWGKAYDGTRVGLNIWHGTNGNFTGTGTNGGWTAAWWEGGWIFNGSGIQSPTNTWQFISVIDDATNVYVYTNAIISVQRACARGTNTSPVKIGEYYQSPWDGGSAHFDGELSDVWVYGKALTASELATLRDNSNPTNDLQARP